jgi:hypothetical protein
VQGPQPLKLLRDWRCGHGKHEHDRFEAVLLFARVDRIRRVRVASEAGPGREVGGRCILEQERVEGEQLLMPAVKKRRAGARGLTPEDGARSTQTSSSAGSKGVWL